MSKILTVMMALVFAGGVNSFAKKHIELKNYAFVEKTIKNKKGKKVVKRLPATKVVPGEKITYVITYENIGNELASDVVINNPIPEHMVFQSASRGYVASVDGGKTFDSLSKLKVKDGKITRPASERDVTHVKWKLAKAIKVKEKGDVEFVAILK